MMIAKKKSKSVLKGCGVPPIIPLPISLRYNLDFIMTKYSQIYLLFKIFIVKVLLVL